MRERDNLKRPTIADRERINNMTVISINQQNGEMTVKNTFSALVAWACAGLECSKEELGEKYGDSEIKEIGEEVQRLASVPFKKG